MSADAPSTKFNIAGRCLAETEDGWQALALAVRITRLRMIERGEFVPEPDEPLPAFLRAQLAA